jgi:hypothetical protein
MSLAGCRSLTEVLGETVSLERIAEEVGGLNVARGMVAELGQGDDVVQSRGLGMRYRLVHPEWLAAELAGELVPGEDPHPVDPFDGNVPPLGPACSLGTVAGIKAGFPYESFAGRRIPSRNAGR